MITKLENFNKKQLKTDLSDIRSGDTIKVHQRIKEGDKERTQIFEGLVIAKKHGKGVSATITVRKVVSGVGVERIFPIHSPSISKIEVTKKGKPRQSKLYYLRTAKGKRAKLKREEYAKAVAEPPAVEPAPETPVEEASVKNIEKE
ncbi:50S ribosomal protein L19 [Patescibacteria group bacterium]|nr:50S ribosomal protein L19 [Patescibacteria group bacterium]